MGFPLRTALLALTLTSAGGLAAACLLMPELTRALAVLFVFLGSCQGFLCGFAAGTCTKAAKPADDPDALLHWNPNIERRGLGDLIRSLNHVALIVSDVGRSLAFYVEVLGFQQIQRPNFDRHGAWLTMGNVELHLIKGVPVVPSGKDLIVSHLALECPTPELILDKFLEMNVPFRQNISVPDPKRARENKEESFDNSDGKVTQYFVRDPDGYYFELCNCDILTKFVLDKEGFVTGKHGQPSGSTLRKRVDELLFGYSEDAALTTISCPMVLKIAFVVEKWVHRARLNLLRPIDERLREALRDVTMAEEADLQLLVALTKRQKTYSDITQGFSRTDLVDALKCAGNHCPTAILILRQLRGDTTVMLPPVYFVNDGGDANFEGNKVNQHVHRTKVRTSVLDKLGTNMMYMGKAFYDNDPAGSLSLKAFEASPKRQDDHLSVAAKLQQALAPQFQQDDHKKIFEVASLSPSSSTSAAPNSQSNPVDRTALSEIHCNLLDTVLEI